MLDECPTNPDYLRPACATMDTDMVCDYGHIYVGCSWETLACIPITTCECGADGTWSCRSLAMAQCETKPEDLPFGQTCEIGSMAPSLGPSLGPSLEPSLDPSPWPSPSGIGEARINLQLAKDGTANAVSGAPGAWNLAGPGTALAAAAVAAWWWTIESW